VLTGLRIGTLRRHSSPASTRPAGRRTLRWSSAGHLQPLLLGADGDVQPLASPPERLLGTDLPSPRTDHELVLQPGDTVVFYTDGLIEHGRSGIDEGIARLTGVLAELPQLPPDELCDQLLGRIVAGRTDDDIAILAVRY
jgi:phosphoserine phosphatase RsbU/P